MREKRYVMHHSALQTAIKGHDPRYRMKHSPSFINYMIIFGLLGTGIFALFYLFGFVK